MTVKATCTWGEGPDVLLVHKDHGFVLYEDPIKGQWVHGIVQNGSSDLTVDEAEELAHQLLNAVAQCRHLDETAEQANRAMEEQGPIELAEMYKSSMDLQEVAHEDAMGQLAVAVDERFKRNNKTPYEELKPFSLYAHLEEKIGPLIESIKLNMPNYIGYTEVDDVWHGPQTMEDIADEFNWETSDSFAVVYDCASKKFYRLNRLETEKAVYQYTEMQSVVDHSEKCVDCALYQPYRDEYTDVTTCWELYAARQLFKVKQHCRRFVVYSHHCQSGCPHYKDDKVYVTKKEKPFTFREKEAKCIITKAGLELFIKQQEGGGLTNVKEES